MKYCLSCRQPDSVLKKVDEIKVEWRDREYIYDLIEKFPDKTIILMWDGSDPNWKTWQMFKEKLANFIIAVPNLFMVDILNQEGLKWYWPYPVTSFAELADVAALGPAYVELGPPVSFSLNKARNVTEVPFRMVVNDPKPIHMPRADTTRGQYVRPEDVSVYEEWVDCFEFKTDSLKEEATYLKIYKEQGNWPGNLTYIIRNLDRNVDNRGVLEDFGVRRAYCGQRCKEGRGCGYCELALTFTERIKNLKVDK